ncbi:MAG: hypothetical protein ACI865_001837 [Flavobacteriaceae bacterium]|jgi:hypothetical protein
MITVRYLWNVPPDMIGYHHGNNKITLVIHSLPLHEVNANETCSITTRNPITSVEFGLIKKEKAGEPNLDLNCGAFYFWNNAPQVDKLNSKANVMQ